MFDTLTTFFSISFNIMITHHMADIFRLQAFHFFLWFRLKMFVIEDGYDFSSLAFVFYLDSVLIVNIAIVVFFLIVAIVLNVFLLLLILLFMSLFGVGFLRVFALFLLIITLKVPLEY